MSRNYPRLEIEPFGRHLIQSGDLDPIYIALARASFDDDLLVFRSLRERRLCK